MISRLFPAAVIFFWLPGPGGSYLTPESSAFNTDNLWNKVPLEINSWLDLHELMGISGQKLAIINGEPYTRRLIYLKLKKMVNRMIKIINTPVYDEIRQTPMIGLSAILGSNYQDAPELVGKRYFYTFHTFSALEAIARYCHVFELNHRAFFERVFNAFEPDWSRFEGAYIDVAGSKYSQSIHPEVLYLTTYDAYNMSASIGMALHWMYLATNEPRYLQRQKKLLSQFHPKKLIVDGVWQYSSLNDRPEDPDHGLEVLRFLSMMTYRGLYPRSNFNIMLRKWQKIRKNYGS